MKKFKLSLISKVIDDLEIFNNINITSIKLKSSDRFDNKTKYQIIFILKTRLLELLYFLTARINNESSLNEVAKEECLGYFQTIIKLEKETHREEYNDLLLGLENNISSDIASTLSLSVIDFFANDRKLAVNSRSSSHLGAFNVQRVSDIPATNFVIKIKNFSGNGIHIRMGIKYENNSLQILNIMDVVQKRT